MQNSQLNLTEPAERWPASIKIQKPAPPLNKKNSLLVGTHGLTRAPVRLSIRDLMSHFYCVSGTRHGKSKLVDKWCQQWIRRPFGLTFIEHHNDVIPNLRRAAILRGLEHKIVDFDFTRPDYTPTLNLLEYEVSKDNETNNQRAIDVATKAVHIIANVFNQQDVIDSMPVLKRWLTVAFFCLAKNGQTILDLHKLFTDTAFRERIVRDSKNPVIDVEWEQFDSCPKSDRKLIEETLMNRIIQFSLNPQIRRIFGSKKSSFSPYRAMQEGQIVLLPLSGLQDPFARRLVTISIGWLYYDQCQWRDPLTQLRPHLLGIDEFDEYFLTPKIGNFLAKGTKFKLSLGLINQSMTALRSEPDVLAQIKSNVRTWIVGAVSHDDAEQEIAPHFWTGSFKATYVKHITEQTKFRPIEETRTVITNSEGESEAEATAIGNSTAKTIGKADTQGVTKSKQKNTSWSKGESDASGENDFESDASSTSFADITGSQYANVLSYPGSMTILEGGISSMSTSSGFTNSNVHTAASTSSGGTGRSSSHSEQSTEGGGEAEGEAETKATSDINLKTEAQMKSKINARGKNRSRSESKVPYDRKEEYREETGREFYTIADCKEFATAIHFNVQPRQFWLKIGRDQPIPIVTQDNRPLKIHPELEAFGRAQIDKNCARQVAEIDAEFYKTFEKSSQPQIVLQHLDNKTKISNNGANTNGRNNVSDFVD